MKLCFASQRSDRAFTLLEVMIAVAIFFLAVFAILELTSGTLKAARGLQQTTVDPGILAAELSLTNRLDEGSESGDFGDFYPDATWTRDVYLVSTNGLYQVDFTVSQRLENRTKESKLTVLYYRPESVVGGGGAGVGQGGTGGGRQ